jgi:flagellar hook-basal body complex protein FliE
VNAERRHSDRRQSARRTEPATDFARILGRMLTDLTRLQSDVQAMHHEFAENTRRCGQLQNEIDAMWKVLSEK